MLPEDDRMAKLIFCLTLRSQPLSLIFPSVAALLSFYLLVGVEATAAPDYTQ